MSEKIYNLVEIFLKFSLWPLLCIIAIILFRGQIRSILSNIGGANSVKLNSAVLNFEATTSKSVAHTQDSEDLVDSFENVKSTIKKPSQDEINKDWFITAQELLNNGKIKEARYYFDDFMKNDIKNDNYAQEHSFFLYLEYSSTLNIEVLKECLTYVHQTGDINKKHFYINSYISCLQLTKQYEKAIKFIEKEIEHIPNLAVKTNLTVRLAQIYTETSDLQKAKDIIIVLIEKLEMIDEDSTDTHLHSAYLQLAEIEKKNNNNFNCALCLDKAAEYSPSDTNSIFNAAYETSNVALTALEVSNYSNLISLDAKNSDLFNNIGVTTDRLNLNLVSGKYYNSAVELGNSLAMANIGGLLLDAGLYVQTEDIIKKALSLGNPHENIFQLATRLNSEKEIQFKKWIEIIEHSQIKQRSIRKYTRSYYCENKKLPTHQHWIDDKGMKVSSQTTKNELELCWESESDNISLTASIVNSSFSGKYNEKKKNVQNSLLGFMNKDISIDCLGFYDFDSEQILIISPLADNDFSRILNKI